jgi:methionine-rich copper-binding protein CopC
MMSRRFGIVGLSFLSLLCLSPAARAADVNVLETSPVANAVIEGRSTEFFVRFDRPVDHLHSLLEITSDGKVIETLHPRAGTAQDLLFARASTLPPGAYKLHWSVVSMAGAEVAQGDVPFSVSGSK